MKKRGQLTLFIIIGIILIVIAGLFFYSKWDVIKEIMKERQKLAGDKNVVENFVTDCLAIASQDALVLLGRQGGYTALKSPYFEILNISYLYNSGRNEVPSTSTIETELADYINKNLRNCINGFESLGEQGINVVEIKAPVSSVAINKKDVVFNLVYDTELRGASSTVSLDKFYYTNNIKLKDIVDAINLLVEFQINNNKSVNSTIFRNYGFDGDVFTYENVLVVLIRDNSSLIKNEPYEFWFANKY